MKPLLTPDGRLETRVVTHFPHRAGVLLTRLDDDNLQIELVIVDQAGRVHPVPSGAAEQQKLAAQGHDGVDHEVAAPKAGLDGLVGAKGRVGLLHKLSQGVRGLFGAGRASRLDPGQVNSAGKWSSIHRTGTQPRTVDFRKGGVA